MVGITMYVMNGIVSGKSWNISQEIMATDLEQAGANFTLSSVIKSMDFKIQIDDSDDNMECWE